ncbi:MAG: hypothetical protein U1F29_07870 [Planctomycetota bacterium]
MSSTRKKTTPAKATTQFSEEEDGRKSALRPDEMPADVLEFITAIDDYKRAHQRPFPTWSEVLEVLKSLGYQRA